MQTTVASSPSPWLERRHVHTRHGASCAMAVDTRANSGGEAYTFSRGYVGYDPVSKVCIDGESLRCSLPGFDGCTPELCGVSCAKCSRAWMRIRMPMRNGFAQDRAASWIWMYLRGVETSTAKITIRSGIYCTESAKARIQVYSTAVEAATRETRHPRARMQRHAVRKNCRRNCGVGWAVRTLHTHVGRRVS